MAADVRHYFRSDIQDYHIWRFTVPSSQDEAPKIEYGRAANSSWGSGKVVVDSLTTLSVPPRWERVFAPLVNFSAHKDRIELEKSLSIEVVSESDRHTWSALVGIGGYLSEVFQGHDRVWQIVKSLDPKTACTANECYHAGAFSSVLNALRILKAGYIQLVLVQSQAPGICLGVIHPQPLSRGTKYEITSDAEESDLGKIWKFLAGGEATRIEGFRTALEFWQVAATYPNNPHYALMFTVMALEALCLSPEDSGDRLWRSEVRYRFSHRLGAYLGKNAHQKMKLSREMRDCYDLRSALAHGDPVDEEKAKPLLPLADEALREIVNRFRQEGKPKDWLEVLFPSANGL